jgi:uncharacterized membrane protein
MAEQELDTVVRTSFTPIRMILAQRKPISLSVEVRNKGKATKGYTVSVRVPTKFGFDESGLVSTHRVRIKAIDPSQAKDAVFKIFPKFGLTSGNYDFDILVREHDERFDRAIGQISVVTSLRVE